MDPDWDEDWDDDYEEAEADDYSYEDDSYEHSSEPPSLAYYTAESSTQDNGEGATVEDDDAYLELLDLATQEGLDPNDHGGMAQLCQANLSAQVAYSAMGKSRGRGKGKSKGKQKSFGKFRSKSSRPGVKGKGKSKPSLAERKQRLIALKKRTRCQDCGEIGHWKGDAECRKKAQFACTRDVKSSSDLDATAQGSTSSSNKFSYCAINAKKKQDTALKIAVYQEDHLVPFGYMAVKQKQDPRTPGMSSSNAIPHDQPGVASSDSCSSAMEGSRPRRMPKAVDQPARLAIADEPQSLRLPERLARAGVPHLQRVDTVVEPEVSSAQLPDSSWMTKLVGKGASKSPCDQCVNLSLKGSNGYQSRLTCRD